jgi:hypothetical protein
MNIGIGKCGCGREGRYFVTADGQTACNKYRRCPTYDEIAETAKKRAEVILFALELIKLSETFDINLGKGWRDFKEKANEIGLKYPMFETNEGKK